MKAKLTALFLAIAPVFGCMPAGIASDRLADTTWRLAEVQSSDDSIGTIRPDDPTRYEMLLGADGTAALRLDCNRATGRWEAKAPGEIVFSQLAMTRALCPEGSLDSRVARELNHVRSYLLEGDALRLIMMADGGSQLWTKAGE